jgi:hypothetical protein
MQSIPILLEQVLINLPNGITIQAPVHRGRSGPNYSGTGGLTSLVLSTVAE